MCRAGAGIEKNPGMGDTPGFPKVTEHTIVKDLCGFWKLLIPRDDGHTSQTSGYIVES